MPYVLCKSYDYKQLNKFSTVLGLGIKKVNRSLLGSSIVVLLLCRMRFQFLLSFGVVRFQQILPSKMLLALLTFYLCRRSCFPCRYVYSVLTNNASRHALCVDIAKRHIGEYFQLLCSAYTYLYWSFCMTFYKSRIFALPSKRSTETVLRSSQGNKKSREQFNVVLHRRGFAYPSFLITRYGHLLRKIIGTPPGASLCSRYSVSY